MKQPEWETLLKRVPAGMTLAQLARHIRQSYRITCKWARKLGYRAANGHRVLWTPARRRQFSRVPWHRINWNKLTNPQIARKYGVSREIIRRRRAEHIRNLPDNF